MFAPILVAVLGVTPAKLATPVVLGPVVASETPVQLGISLQLTHPAEMAALRHAQLDPHSPDYRRWLTPEQFGQQFGQPEAFYLRVQTWLQQAGFEVTPFHNQAFIEAIGTASQVKSLLGVTLSSVKGAAASVHVPNRSPELPGWLSSQVVYVSGLDTRVRAHHRLYDSYNQLALGPQDLRVEWDISPMFTQGFYGQQQNTVVLAWAEAPGSEVQAADVNYFYQSVSNASATFVEHKIANPNGDFDSSQDGRVEFELDVEMQSVGAPGASTITLDDSPASQIFTIGAEDIAENFSTAAAVSTSIGICETEEAIESPGEASTMEMAVIQGTMEGQSWSAAAGDQGADDCQTGGFGPISVDFPGVLPEVVSMGGLQIVPAKFNRDQALTPTFKSDAGAAEGHQTEQVWNDQELAALDAGSGNDASGGGISTIFAAPSYQTSLGFTFRSVPDLALIAGAPYTIAITNQPGEFDPLEGTSIASPLSAGFFALIASWQGCRLGDPHQVLYDIGRAYFDGGLAGFGAGLTTPGFNDVVTGNNSVSGLTGFSATVGYDSVSGWGSMDVYELAQLWPACTPQQLDAGWGTNDGGVLGTGAGAEYDACKFSGCNRFDCTTLPDGPSTCTVLDCDPELADAGNGSGFQCPLDSACFTSGPYAGDGDAGACASGCIENSDCDAGSCNGCYNSCQTPGTPGAKIGGPCTQNSDCGPGGTCITTTDFGVYFDGGYCSSNCNPFSVACADVCDENGSNGSCQFFGEDFYTCLEVCTTNADCRPGYICQPQTSYCGDGGGDFFNDPNGGGPCPSVCEPFCQIVDAGPMEGIYNTCVSIWGACDPETGECVIVDGGGVVIATGGTTGTTGPTATGTTGAGASTGSSTSGTATATTATTSGTATATATATIGASTGHPTTSSATGTSGSSTATTGSSTTSTTGTTGTKSTTSGAAAASTTTTTTTSAAASGGSVAASGNGGSTGAGGSSTGCSCAAGKGSPDALFGLLGLVLLARRRRRA